jgi:hypothetical protein
MEVEILGSHYDHSTTVDASIAIHFPEEIWMLILNNWISYKHFKRDLCQKFLV